MPAPESDAAGIAVILGGTGDIGSAVARRLARPGGVLVLGYLANRARAETIARDLETRGATVHLVEGNVARPEVLDRIASLVQERGGRCHHLVHSVAVTGFKPLSEVKSNQWDLILNVSARSLLDAAAIEACGVDPAARPETLTPLQFSLLAQRVPAG